MGRSLRRESSPRRLRRAVLTTAATTRSSTSGAATDDYQVKLGYFPNLTHASAIVGIEKGYFEDALEENGAIRQDLRLQQWQRHDRRAAQRRPRRHLHRPQPDHHRVRAVAGQRRRSQRRDLRRRLARRQRTTSTSPEDLKGKTLATPGLANTQDVALKYWLKERGLQRRPRRQRRRHRAQPGQQPDGPDLQDRRHRRRVGPRAVRLAAGRRGRQGPRRRGGPLAGRRVRDHAAHRQHRLPRRAPGPGRRLLAGQIKANTTSPTTPTTRSRSSATTSRTSPADADPCRCPRLGVEQAHLHQRPHRGLAASRATTTRSTSASSNRSTTWPTSTTSTRSTSCSPTPASRKCQDHRRDDHIARGSRAPGAIGSGAPAIRIKGVSKTFGRGSEFTVALKEVDLDVAEREFLCIVGASGCGKSTLLNLIAELDKPSTGTHRDRRPQGRVHVPGGHAVPVAHRRPERRPGAQAARHAEVGA